MTLGSVCATLATGVEQGSGTGCCTLKSAAATGVFTLLMSTCFFLGLQGLLRVLGLQQVVYSTVLMFKHSGFATSEVILHWPWALRVLQAGMNVDKAC